MGAIQIHGCKKIVRPSLQEPAKSRRSRKCVHDIQSPVRPAHEVQKPKKKTAPFNDIEAGNLTLSIEDGSGEGMELGENIEAALELIPAAVGSVSISITV